LFLQRCFYVSILSFLFFTFLPAVTHAAQADISWLPNSETNLAGYEIHYGTTSQNYTTVIDVGLPEPVDGRIHAAVDDLAEGNTYFFAAKAYDSNGDESDYSQEISYTVTSSEPSPPPVANDLVVNTTEDTPVTDQLSVNNSGGLPLQYTVISSPFHGILTVKDATGSFTFTPTPDFNGTDSFTFTAANDNGESNIATVKVVIAPANNTPVAYPANFTTQEDTVVSGQLAANDPDGDTFTYTMVTSPAQGTASMSPSGSFTYAPAANSSGTDSFSYTVNDGFLNSAPAIVTITVNPVNDAPVAENSVITVEADTATSGLLDATDAEQESLTYSLKSSPSQGTVTISPNDRTFTYTAHKDGSGNDFFSFQADDGVNTSNIATVSITIIPAAPSLVLEAGEVDVDHNWIHIDLDESFTNPVVIARLVSKNDSEPCLVRINSVSSAGFDLRLQEYGYLDDIHPKERISFIVLEAGHHQLADGTQIEAGSISVGAIRKKFDRVKFSNQFSVTPVVITSIASVNEYDAVTTRIKKINKAGFKCKLQEQESNRKQHVPETVNYLAWEPSAGYDNGIRYEVATTGNRVRHTETTVEYNNSFKEIPLVVTDMQTTDGKDTSIMRVLQVSEQAIEIMVEEEQSKNSETGHTTENGGFIAIQAE
jgi:VCBS repeat-containing protein